MLCFITFGGLRKVLEIAIQISGFQMVPGFYQKVRGSLVLPGVPEMLAE
jgi:hypothetical protein